MDSKPGFLDLLQHRWARVVLEGLGIVAFFWLITRLSSVLTPVLVGLILAYMLDPVINYMTRRGMSRRLATSLVFGSGALVLLVTLAVGIPKAWHEGRILYQGAVLGDSWKDVDGNGKWEEGEPLIRDINGNGKADPSYLKAGHDFLVARGLISSAASAPPVVDGAAVPAVPTADSTGDHPASAADEEGPDFDPQSWLKEQAKSISRTLRAGDRSVLHKTLDIFGKIGFWLLVLLLIPIYGYFFSLNLPMVSRTIMEHVPLTHRERTLRIFAEINQVVGAFFRGRVLICLILGIIAGIGFAIGRVPSWFVLAAVMGFATAIPLAPALVLAPVCMLLYLSGAEQWQYLAAGATYLVVHGLEPVLIAVIMGHGVEMHPVILVVAIFSFGALFGTPGALLAVPLAATARILLREFLYPQVRRMAGLDVDADGAAKATVAAAPMPPPA